MDPHPRITLLGRSCIVPSIPTKREPFFLSCLDIFWQDMHYNQRVIFYQIAGGQQGLSNAIDNLKRSLSQVLVHFFPWAGRLALGEDGRMVIDCNDLGVEFVEASIDLPMSELEKEDFQMKDFFEKLCQPVEHKGESLFTSPLLSVQATRFSDGGLAVAVAQSHVVADGQSLWHFMVSWGECARGEAISMQPMLDRKKLAVPNPSPDKAFLNVSIREENNFEKQKTTEQTTKQLPAKSNTHESSPEPLLQCTFRISEADIRTLKNEAEATALPQNDVAIATQQRPFSSYEVLCAHLWQRGTIARNLPVSATVSFCVLANFRTRITPPLPSSYFGNVITFSPTVSTAGEVSTESLGSIASKIRLAIASCKESTLTGTMHWLEVNNNRIFHRLVVDGHSMMVASSPRFPAYDVDYGFGKPLAVRAVKVHSDGEAVMFGGNPRGGSRGDVEMCVCLGASAMRNLLRDPSFLAYPASSLPV